MVPSKPQLTPMISSLRLTQDGFTAFQDPTLYRFIMGALQYQLITHPELAYSINNVCQYMHQLQEHHWKVVKRI